jgi:hypothetical protein
VYILTHDVAVLKAFNVAFFRASWQQVRGASGGMENPTYASRQVRVAVCDAGDRERWVSPIFDVLKTDGNVGLTQ